MVNQLPRLISTQKITTSLQHPLTLKSKFGKLIEAHLSILSMDIMEVLTLAHFQNTEITLQLVAAILWR